MPLSIIDAINSPEIFKPAIRGQETWWPWTGCLKAIFGLPMNEAEAALFRECTGRDTLPTAAFAIIYLICGRRAGKSFVLALIACFKAAFEDYSPYLSVGERATIVIVAVDRKQARTIHRYCLGILSCAPALQALIEGETADEIRLVNGVNIEIMTASSKTLRGYAVPVALFDELAFFAVEGAADAADDMIGSIGPAMKQFPNPMFLGGSSPYSQKGPVWTNYRKYYGEDNAPVLVWKAPTWTMNPTISRSSLNHEYEKDHSWASGEFGAEFRSDLESFVDRDVVEAAVIPNRRELPPQRGLPYKAFMDPSGGRGDAMTCAIAHRDQKGNAVLDAIRITNPPLNPQDVVAEYAAFFKSYGITRVMGDNYAAEWVVSSATQNGLTYEKSDKPRSEIYLNFLPLLNSGKIELLDNTRLIHELCSLERRTSRSGKDSVNHPPHGHDDAINSAAGALVLAGGGRAPMRISPEALAYWQNQDQLRLQREKMGIFGYNPPSPRGGKYMYSEEQTHG